MLPCLIRPCRTKFGRASQRAARRAPALDQGRWVSLTYILANTPLQGHIAQQAYMPTEPI